MIVVRLAKGGAKKHPFYHIVVTDSRRRRDSGYLERLGYFNPFAVKDEIPVLLNQERFDYWISKGAKSSPRVSSIISKLGKGKVAVKEKVKKNDAGIIEPAKATETEIKPPAETEVKELSAESKPQTQAKLELENKPESTHEEKQTTSPEADARSEDADDALNAETPAEAPESSETNKKAENK